MSRFIASPSIRISAAFALLLLIFLILVGFRYDSLPHNPGAEFSDSTISRWPDTLYFQRSIQEHHTFPLWNPHLMGGQPFAANPGTKVWYPVTWLLMIWSAAFHINFMTAFHLWTGAMGMWAWAKRTGLYFWPALLAATGYLFAPKLLAHAGAGHIDLLIAMGWLPWLLFFIHRNVVDKKSRPVNVIALAFVGAMLFIGAIQILIFTFGLGCAYSLYLISQRTDDTSAKHFYWIGLAAIFGAGFSAVQWIPLIELREAVSRGEIRQEDAALYSVKVGQFLGLMIGDHTGNPETLTYVGVSVLILALTGLLLRPRENRFWWGVVIFAVLYSLGENFFFWSGLVKIFPPLLLFRVPGRAWFLATLTLPYLAGWGLQFLIENPLHTARARLGVVAFCGLGITCSLSSAVILGEFVRSGALIGLLALPVTAILIALYIFERLSSKVLLPLFTLVVLIDCVWIGQALIEGRTNWLNKKPPALLENINGRIYTPGYAIPQQNTAYWNISRFDGVDPFQLKNFVELSEVATGVPREGYSTTVPAEVVLEPSEENLDLQNAPVAAELLGRWGVEWIITTYPVEIEGLEFITQEAGIFYYKNSFFEPFQLVWDSPNRVTQTVSKSGIFTVANAPGWQTEDGKRVDSDLLSLPAVNGTFIYHPRGVYIGIVVSGVSYGLALLWLILHWLNGGVSRFLRWSSQH